MKTVKIIYGALLTAIKILLTRFFSIQLPIMRFSFAFIATMMIGMLFNPWVSGAIAAVTDIIGFAIAPKGNVVFINMTLNTLWVSMTTGKAFIAVAGPRVVKNLVDIPLRVIIFTYLIKLLNRSAQFKKVIQEA